MDGEIYAGILLFHSSLAQPVLALQGAQIQSTLQTGEFPHCE